LIEIDSMSSRTRRSIALGVMATLPLALIRPNRAWGQAQASPPQASAVDPKNERLLQQVEWRLQQAGGSRVVELSFHAPSGKLAIGYESGSIEAWTGADAPVVVPAHRGRANSIRFGPIGDYFISNSYFDDATRIWDARTGAPLHVIPGTRGPVSETSLDGIFVVAGSSALHLYDHASRRLSPPAVPAPSGVPLSLAWHAATKSVAMGTASGTLDLWRVDGSGVRAEVWRAGTARPYATGDWIVATGFSRDGRAAYTVTRSGVLAEWSLEPLERKRTIPLGLRFVHSARFHNDSDVVALAGTLTAGGLEEGAVEIVSLKASRPNALHRVSSNLAAIAFVPRDKLLLVVSHSRVHRIAWI